MKIKYGSVDVKIGAEHDIFLHFYCIAIAVDA